MRGHDSLDHLRRVFAVLALAMLWSAVPARADQILQTSSDSLTTYKYSGNTRVQGVRPRAEQRGVGFDGAQRAGGSLPWALAGNPFESAQAGETLGSLRLATGAYAPTEIDLALPAQVPWIVGRTFNARQAASGGAHLDSDGYQGRNWFQISQPEIRLYDADGNAGTKQAADLVYLVYGADRYVEFKRTADNADTFRGVNGAAGIFKYESGSPDLYVYTDQNGNRTYFFGSNAQVTIGLDTFDAAWQLWKFVDPSGNTAYVGHATTASTAISSGYYKNDGQHDGRIKLAFDSEGRRYCYTYSTPAGDSVARLAQVVAEINAGGGWGDCGTETLVGKVEYAYYQTGDTDNGGIGNLKLVTITTPLSDPTKTLTRRQYYRYYTGTYHATNNPGHPNTIKMMLGYEGTRRADWDDNQNLDGSLFAMSEGDLKPYADAFFKYDSDYRVISVYFDGECGCAGGTNGEHKLSYEDNPGFSGTSGYDTAWHRRVVIEPPTGGAWVTQYLDEVGQPLSRVLTDANPANTSPAPAKWVTQVVRNSDGQVTEVHTPANVTGYTHNTGGNPDGAITTSGTAGLVHYYQRVGSGDTKGFLEGVRQKEGSNTLSTNSTFVSWTQYLTRDLSIATGVNVTRPLVEKTRAFHTATTDHTDTTKYDETTQSYTWWENTTATDVLYVTLKQVTTTATAVSTGKNGSGSATTTKRYLRKDGTAAFAESARGIFHYTAYTGGQVTKRIEDVKTNGTFPTGDDPNTDWGITESGDGFGRVTEYAYDDQGRMATSTLPGGRVTMRWYAKLGDERMVTFGVPLVGSWRGPSSYTVTNHAGNTEECMILALAEPTGAKSHPSAWLTTVAEENLYADPPSDSILALSVDDAGPIARLTASAYGTTGRRLESRRVFFEIPASMAPGDTSGKYDEWTVAYDHMGRQIRTKEPSGTITRTVYDVLGRVTSRKIGTNDNGKIGGETSGTNNMVTTEALVYDGRGVGGGGNSLLTTRTLYVEDGTTGQRQTTYTYDYRGRLIVTVNPQAPHVVAKYDNLGRMIASGLFSSSSGLTASTDPTTTTSNRVALSQTFYDERGQVWKSQRHKITQSTGADADNLQTLNWYDPDGRLIKTDGEQLIKTRYDRLGRVVQSFILAADNDTSYSDVYDSTNKFASIAGDKVLEERQTGYDGALDEVLVQATIERTHDDTSTTGALDTTYDGGDGLPLKFTAADVKGRIQISATWYDDLDRPRTAAFYGTNAATDNVATFDRDGLTEPTASDTNPTTRIVTKTVYGTDGTVKETIDANGRVSKFVYDSAGRLVASIGNSTGASTPISNATRDTDAYTRYVYTNGLQVKVWVDLNGDNTEDSDDQITEYVYGTTKGTPGSGSPVQSAIATGHLLREVIYPPGQAGSAQADRTVTYAYNAQGEQVWTMDQAGNVTQTDFDTAGRETHRRVATLAGGFDGAVRRISTTYLPRGLVNKVTQYDNAAVGSGSLVDDVKYTYDDWGNVYQFKQDVDSDLDGTPAGRAAFQVDYSYAMVTTGRNTIRRTGMNLPGATAVTFNYISTGGRLDDAASRVTRVNVAVGPNDPSPVPVAQYEYLGGARLVGTDLLQPKARSNYFEGAVSGTPYPDLDRFNRVEDSRWTGYKGTGTRDFYDVDVAYDPASNILGVTDTVHKNSGGNRNFDALYTLDALNRLTRADEGTLTWSGGTGTISNRSRDERWLDASGNLALSQTGNWLRRRLDLNGDGNFTGTNELDDTGVFSLANELKTRDTDSNGTVNYTLAYDKTGNQTNDGKDYTYVYDAFGRMRQVKSRSESSPVAEYRYNGLGFRIGWHYDADADKDVDGDDPWYFFCYDDAWRIVATFLASDADPKEVFVYHNAGLGGNGGSSYIDTVILRDRDADTKWSEAADDKREERRYYCQNWHADVSAILTDTGGMVEWVKYSSYGVPFALPAGDTDSDGDWDATDSAAITGTYDVRKDANLDGAINASDVTHANSITGGYQTLGRGRLSSSGVDNRKGYAGYEYDPTLEAAGKHLYHVRHRVYDADIGRWTRRDPLGYVDGMSLYEYVKCRPLTSLDPDGLFTSLGHPSSVCHAAGAATLNMTIREAVKFLACQGMSPKAIAEALCITVAAVAAILAAQEACELSHPGSPAPPRPIPVPAPRPIPVDPPPFPGSPPPIPIGPRPFPLNPPPIGPVPVPPGCPPIAPPIGPVPIPIPIDIAPPIPIPWNPGCPPCVPPPPRYDKVPPSRPHYPCPGSHTHWWWVTGQGPPPDCKCSFKEEVSCH
ncbi:MAG: RHS repeat-associated core domain-containing protein [Phycisphaerae bacterium]|nr:RHS repeat-associated core domain-containing protein [Phycisphaerae bacterium]